MKRILFIVAILTAPAYAAEPNLVAWWQFDEASGTIAYDSAGDNDGNLINGPIWTTGLINGALNFDGIDDYVNIPDSNSLDLSSQATVSAWINTNSPTTLQGIVGRWNYAGGPPPYNYSILLHIMGDTSKTVRLCVSTSNSDSGASYLPSIQQINANTWYHIAGTYDGATMKLYINGQLNNSMSKTGNIFINNTNWYIGTFNYGNMWYFNGLIDDVRVYNRALSAEEIWQLYRVEPIKAFNPYPADGVSCLPLNLVLLWWPGKYAVSHDVYLGTDFNEVNETNTSDTSGIYRVRQDANNYDPCGLEASFTYYWRIDEVNNANINSPWKGDIWSFTTTDLNLPPMPPDILTYPAADGNNGRYEINWSAVADASGYKLQRSSNGGLTWTTVYTGSDTTWCEDVNTGNYRYRVCTIASGCSVIWNTGSTDCAVVLCFPTSEPNMTTWKALGKPRCWCYQRQCKGDGDGVPAIGGSTKVGYWYVGAEDLTGFTKAFLIRGPPKGPDLQGEPNICYDLDHVLASGGSIKIGYWRVGAEDLTIFAHSFLVKEPPKGSGIGSCPAGASGSRYTLPTDYKPCN